MELTKLTVESYLLKTPSILIWVTPLMALVFEPRIKGWIALDVPTGWGIFKECELLEIADNSPSRTLN